jgi:hypothetical protein
MMHSLRQIKLYINVFKDDHHFEKKKDILMLHSIVVILFVSIAPISFEKSRSKNLLVKSFKETKYSWSQNFTQFSKVLCII